MDIANGVTLACQHQSEIARFLEGAGIVMPVASLVTWATARWQRLPPGLQTILQLLAGNLAHAILGEPTAPVLSGAPAAGNPPTAPVPLPADPPAPAAAAAPGAPA